MAHEVPVHDQRQIDAMRRAGAIVGNTLARLRESVKPGVTTADLDRWAREEIENWGGRPSFPEVIHPQLRTPFPGAICTSVNDEIVHGIPSSRRLNEGDIVSIDVGVIYQDMHGDAAVTLPVGEVDAGARKLLDATEEALRRAIERVRPGRPLFDIGETIDKYATAKGLGIVRQYVGHGIGQQMHEPPQVPNYRMPSRGPSLKSGWTIAIEPMLNLGSANTKVLPDKWTVVTADGSLSAHFEHTVAVTPRGHAILTLPGDPGNGSVR